MDLTKKQIIAQDAVLKIVVEKYTFLNFCLFMLVLFPCLAQDVVIRMKPMLCDAY